MILLRTFIALDIPPDLVLAIREATEPARAKIGTLVRWVPMDTMHLTLKFLGDVSPAGLEPLYSILRTEADLCSPFEMQVGGLGAFPNLRRPRVLFLGLHAPVGLEALARGIESACQRLGYNSEGRGFHPHLTLGRVRQSVTPADLQKIRVVLETATIDLPGSARVDSVQLYKSELTRDGALYTRLFTAPLHPVHGSHEDATPMTNQNKR
jgi:2'-5' RNA ligase